MEDQLPYYLNIDILTVVLVNGRNRNRNLKLITKLRKLPTCLVGEENEQLGQPSTSVSHQGSLKAHQTCRFQHAV